MTKKVKNNRIYLDDDDVYMRDYAKWNKNGFYLSYEVLIRIRDYNSKANNNRYYFSPGGYTHCCNKIMSLAGMKTFKYKRVRMRGRPFFNDHVFEGNKYYVINEPIRRLFHILDNTDNNQYSMSLLFNACLSNYDITEYMTYYKNKNPEYASDHCIVRYYRYKQMELDYVDKYKENIQNALSNHFYKDVSNIINDYLIKIVK